MRKDEPGQFAGPRKAGSGSFDKEKRGGSSRFDKEKRGPYKEKRGFGGGHSDKDKRESNKDKRADRKEFYSDRNKNAGAKRPFSKKESGFGRDRFDKEERSGHKEFQGEKRSFSKKEGGSGRDHFDKEKRSFGKEKQTGRKESYGEKKPFSKKEGSFGRSSFNKEERNSYKDKRAGDKKPYGEKRSFHKKSDPKKSAETFAQKGLIRLNRYIANAGICSRREADDLITTGCISVNGKVITELGYKVKDGDDVNYSGQRLKTEKHVYVLLNKPKDYITTAEDDRGRRTVMELIAGACKERVYPVGRLDRNTMGLLLFTNDGEMTKKLTHPKHRVQKLYHVELDKNLKQDDLVKIQEGLELEDGFIKPDEVSYAGESKREVGILIHSGRNRIVRRIFEQLGYDVVRLDRIMFAGLTKKDLPRGHWRLLSEKEIAFLKMA